MNKKVIYVDDDIDARNTYSRFLNIWFGDDFEILAPEIKPSINEMLTVLLSQNNVVAYVFDEKLRGLGKADYLGQELASAIRDLDHKIPIYILTSYSEDFEGSGPAEVEYILSKTDIDNERAVSAISARLRRHQNIFEDIKSERAERLDFLICKSIDGTLDSLEKVELDKLNFLKEKVIIMEESDSAKNLKEALDVQEKKLNLIDEMINKMD